MAQPSKRLTQVGEQVVDRLDARRVPHQPLGDSERGALLGRALDV